ncbi:MAG: sulfatase, partial [Candidatus Eisenbacteria sp.]|nr:sulfatase [Candidatus Eisenbacteria bacterium]
TALRKAGRVRFGRNANVLSGLGLAIIVLSGVAFTRSPLIAPARFRVAHAQQVTQDPQRPNVLWIVLDTARADRMNVYGYSRETTPFLKRWSSRAILFDRCISNGMWTVPSHASMFTGLSLRQHGADHQHPALDESFVTVAEVLRGAGYNTALFSNNPLIAPGTNLDQGFDVSRVVRYLGRLTRFSSLEDLCERWGLAPLLPWWDHDFGGAVTNQLISDWLDNHGNRGEPFFLFVNYMEAHLPYAVPKKYRRMFMTNEQVARSYELRRRAFGPINGVLDMRFNLDGPEFLVPADREVLKRQYEASLRYLDDRISELIRMLEERDHLENTIVVITSDHGEYLDTHGMWSHRFLTYNDLVHVSLILHVPGRDQRARVPTPVQLSDLYATVLNAALGGREPGPGFGSRDLLELADCPEEPRVVITECGGPHAATRRRAQQRDNPIVLHRIQPQIAAQDGRFKYIISADGERELYDLFTDPGELHNLIDVEPAEAERLEAFIEHWHESTPRYQPSDEDEIREMEPDVIEALRSLGYLGS